MTVGKTNCKLAMSPAESDALERILRIAGVGILGGASLRTGIESLRQSNPRYEPPKIPDPVIVTIPRPVDSAEPPSKFPALNRMKMLPPAPHAKGEAPPKSASWTVENTIKALPMGEKLWENIPQTSSILGPANPTSGNDIPLTWAAYPLAAAGGTGIGYALSDKILRAADRRRARSDLEAAQREYQDATIGRARSIHFPEKSAAEMTALIEGRDPVDPVVARIKRAIDRAYAVSQIAGSTGGGGVPNAISSALTSPLMPSPAPVASSIGAPSATLSQPAPPKLKTTMPSEPAMNGSGATEPDAIKSSQDPTWMKRLTEWMYPGSYLDDDALKAHMLIAGAGAGLGGWLGYNHGRDKETAEQNRRAIRRVDRENASAIPAPMIAQFVPVQKQQPAV